MLDRVRHCRYSTLIKWNKMSLPKQENDSGHPELLEANKANLSTKAPAHDCDIVFHVVGIGSEKFMGDQR